MVQSDSSLRMEDLLKIFKDVPMKKTYIAELFQQIFHNCPDVKMIHLWYVSDGMIAEVEDQYDKQHYVFKVTEKSIWPEPLPWKD